MSDGTDAMGRQAGTHVIESPVGIELVHEAAQGLVRLFGLLDPAGVRMDVAHELAHVDDAAEDIAETVEVLHHVAELCGVRVGGGGGDAGDEGVGVEDGAAGEGREGVGGGERREAAEGRRGRGGRGREGAVKVGRKGAGGEGGEGAACGAGETEHGGWGSGGRRMCRVNKSRRVHAR